MESSHIVGRFYRWQYIRKRTKLLMCNKIIEIQNKVYIVSTSFHLIPLENRYAISVNKEFREWIRIMKAAHFQKIRTNNNFFIPTYNFFYIPGKYYSNPKKHLKLTMFCNMAQSSWIFTLYIVWPPPPLPKKILLWTSLIWHDVNTVRFYSLYIRSRIHK